MADRDADRILHPFVDASFACDRCGREAAHLTLFARGLAEPISRHPPIGAGLFPTLVIDAGRLSTRIGSAALGADTFLAALAAADPAALYAVDPEFAPFWCPDCRAGYCADEWVLEEVWDGDFWDELRGTCPAGHRRMIYD